jgi:polar amino acid transport system substrate-binding protein
MAAAIGRILLAALALLLSARTSLAADLPVRLVTGNGYAPYTDISLPDGGFATEVVRLTMRELGEPVSISFMPWKRAMLATQAGEFIGTFPYIRSTEREAAFLFSDPLYLVDNRVFVLRGSTLRYREPADLVGKVACNQLGSAHPPALQRLIDSGQIRLETPRALSSCFRMMVAGRVDFVSINELVADEAIREAFGNLDRFSVSGPPVDRVGLYLMVSRQSADGARFLQRFNAALARAKRDPQWHALEQQFLVRHDTASSAPGRP